MERAAETFWCEIAGTDESVSLSRLRARLERIDTAHVGRRLTIFIDNVIDPRHARRLIEQNWDGWGFRFAMTCPPEVANAIRPALKTRGRVHRVADFALAELQAYLAGVAGVDWASVPFDVQRTLRRPLLAKLFRDVVSPGEWRPANEYELFHRCWRRLAEYGAGSFDIDPLRKLAGEVMRGDSYPWAPDRMREAGFDDLALRGLVAAGWLRETALGAYDIWHDRLLNWAAAEAAAHRITHYPAEADEWFKIVAALLLDHRSASGRLLGYVPMDLLWLLCDESGTVTPPARRLIAAFESALAGRAAQWLGPLLPTLGGRAVPILIEKLRLAAAGPWQAISGLIDGLVEAAPNPSVVGLRLLGEVDVKMRRVGACILAECPDPAALDDLWRLHVEGRRNPKSCLWDHESDGSLYEDTFGAVAAACIANPVWLERTILTADPADPVHDLAYLVARSGDSDLWRRCKHDLKQKVGPDHPRSLATCVQLFRDGEEADWLASMVGQDRDMVGATALRALAAIDPNRAFACIDSLPETDLRFTRSWSFGSLRRRFPDRAREYFAARSAGHPDPWRFAMVLQDFEDSIDPESFERLLDRLAEMFAGACRSEHPAEAAPILPINFLKKVCCPHLITRMRLRRGTPLETRLVDWLLVVGPQSGQMTQRPKIEVLDILAMIGGEGLGRVLDDWLTRGDWYARVHALDLCRRRADPGTLELLTALSRVELEEPRDRLIPGHAAAALATHSHWGPVQVHVLREGWRVLLTVVECCPDPMPPLDDASLAPALGEFRSPGGPTAGSLLALGLSNRRDLLPSIRDSLQNADPSHEVAGAALVAMQWLGDNNPEIVPSIARCLPYHHEHAIDALLINNTAQARSALAAELCRAFDFSLAAIIANCLENRETALDALERALADRHPIAWGQLSTLVRTLNPDALSAAAARPGILGHAEDIAFADYQPSWTGGEKPAALRIVGQLRPDAALHLALSRLRDRRTPDAEAYAPLVVEFGGPDAAELLMGVVAGDPPARIGYAVGRQLRRLNANDAVLGWLRDPNLKRRFAACSVAGHLTRCPEIEAALLACLDAPDFRLTRAAGQAVDALRRQEVVAALVKALPAEADAPHRWTLIDGLISAGDPGDGDVPPYWLREIRECLSPAMRLHLNKRLEKRQGELVKKLNCEDRTRDS